MVTVATPVAVSKLVVTKSSGDDDTDEKRIREYFWIPSARAPPLMRQLAEEARASWWEIRIMAPMTLFGKQDQLDSAFDGNLRTKLRSRWWVMSMRARQDLMWWWRSAMFFSFLDVVSVIVTEAVSW
jgi:hypothetical protein